MQTPNYAELCARSCFSFLRGASQPEELVERAKELGLASLAICDRNGIYGQVRAWSRAKKLGQELVIGAELSFADTESTLLLLVQDHRGYANLCRLLTQAHADKAKGQGCIELGQLQASNGGLLAIVPCPYTENLAEGLRDIFGKEKTWLAVERHFVPEQAKQEAQAKQLAQRLGLQIIATARPLYHDASRKPVADVLHCIRKGTTLDSAGRELSPNAEAALQTPQRFAHLFREHPEWLKATLDIASMCKFSLAELRYRFPSEYMVSQGESAETALRRIVGEKTAWRYPQGAPEAVERQIAKELDLIERLGVAPYFLSVFEIVEIARERRILCQGRGSAANSAVCFVLGITAVDPARANLLFERFISAERSDPPDIDVDFEHERREEVIQEIYRRYGRERSAMVSEVVSYRSKSALREVGKAFGLSLEQADRLSGMLVHSYSSFDVEASDLTEVGLDANDPRLQKVVAIAREIIGFPRHLSIHVGGFVLSSSSLLEVAPIEPARMPGRTVIPWDKDDLDALGFFKIDLLSLGMLSCLRKALSYVHPEKDPLQALAQVPAEDPQVYDALCQADTIGVFQIESRAQMSMLPRLRPRRFYDLVIQVAIVRPGPIQGGMVHPYLKRRAGKEPVSYPHQKLRPILQRTLGVPLFQEQVMQIAIEGAGYTGGEADQLRRDMAAWKKHGRLMMHREKLLSGFAKIGISKGFGEQLFKQIQGFGEYGFPESHAASFALLVYASSWLKTHHPGAFACGLINSQPMGFYSPSTIIRDAQAHGVKILPIRVTESDWDCRLLENGKTIRLGMRLIRGFGQEQARLLICAREQGAFLDLEDLVQRTGLRKLSVEALAEAGALEDLVPGRRQALWASRAPRSGPLFQNIRSNENKVLLRPLRAAEQLVLDYARVGLSINDHPMRHVRKRLSLNVLPIANLAKTPDSTQVEIAGLVLNRQQPHTASGVVFMTLEDETGMANLVLWSKVFEENRHTAVHGQILWVRGKLERKEGVSHVIVQALDRLDLPSGGQDASMSQIRSKSRDFC